VLIIAIIRWTNTFNVYTPDLNTVNYVSRVYYYDDRVLCTRKEQINIKSKSFQKYVQVRTEAYIRYLAATKARGFYIYGVYKFF